MAGDEGGRTRGYAQCLVREPEACPTDQEIGDSVTLSLELNSSFGARSYQLTVIVLEAPGSSQLVYGQMTSR